MEPIFARRVPGETEGLVGLTEAGDDEQATIYHFEPIPALPNSCTTPDRSDRAAVIAIADLMTEHYPGFAEREIDFAARRAEVLSRLPLEPTPDQAWMAAESLLTGFNDPHLELAAENREGEHRLHGSEGPTLDAVHARPGDHPERDWLRTWREGVERTILEGQGHSAANNRLFWGVTDEVGYLAVVTMGGFNAEDDADFAPLDQALDQAMNAFAGARAVIVDVSNNRGGYDFVSRRIAGRFTDVAYLAYQKRGSDRAIAPQPLIVQPYSGPRYSGPVWILTSDITVSAGETFTQMMRGRPGVVLAGGTTRGAFSDQTPVPLANGWRFAMPMETYLTPDGVSLEGRGLEPDTRIDLYPRSNLDHGHAEAVRALIRRLAS